MVDRDLDRAATDRAALQRQYGDESNYVSRVSLYACLESDDEVTSFPEWVLDAIPWTGAESVLDVGCGPGMYTSPLLARAAVVAAMDLSEGMAHRAAAEGRSSAGRAGALVGNAERLPVRDASVDVVVAAHMLYHVPDIPAALSECRRVLRPGGVLLASANGAADKAELLAVWQAAGERAVGPRFRAPGWGRRFNVDVGVPMLERVFNSVEVKRRSGVFRVPSPEPVITWLESLRAGTEDVLDDDQWHRVVTEVRRAVAEEVAARGVFAITQQSGVIVARA